MTTLFLKPKIHVNTSFIRLKILGLTYLILMACGSETTSKIDPCSTYVNDRCVTQVVNEKGCYFTRQGTCETIAVCEQAQTKITCLASGSPPIPCTWDGFSCYQH